MSKLNWIRDEKCEKQTDLETEKGDIGREMEYEINLNYCDDEKEKGKQKQIKI